MKDAMRQMQCHFWGTPARHKICVLNLTMRKHKTKLKDAKEFCTLQKCQGHEDPRRAAELFLIKEN